MTKRILLVEDNDNSRKALRMVLGAYGYGVETAADGQEALDALGRDSYSGVLLDIRLPKVDGLEVLRRARNAGPCPPVIMMTAAATLDNQLCAIKEGAQEFLIKPFDGRRLKQALDSLCGKPG